MKDMHLVDAAESAPEAEPRLDGPAPRLPYAFARRFGVALRADPGGRGLECIHRPGAPIAALAEARRVAAGAGLSPRHHALDAEAFDELLAGLYRDSASDASEAASAADDDLAALADTAAASDDLLEQADDAPVVRLINALMLEAIRENASDIHVEVQERRLVVRFRVDGVLRERLEPNRALAPLLISRIKVMAKLDIAEKRLPQDGRVSLRVGGHEVDMRVSTLPSQYGERAVLRLLDRGATRLGLEGLGMSPRDLGAFARLLQRPDGILLVTGPTGSGKTTSLYAAMGRLNDSSRNIMTVEDPIEYALDGVGQTQVDARAGYDFARGLRAILRQDPDVIMVGEIRDRETARTAVEAAMTGHFVLSTLHTNTAVGAVSRLIDMGVERFLLAPMLAGVVAQRLVRRLCPDCAEREPAGEADVERLGGRLVVGEPVGRARGCTACHGVGHRGRAGIYEVVAASREMEALIHAGASEAELEAEARRRGPDLMDDGARAVRAGITCVEEVARVAQEV